MLGHFGWTLKIYIGIGDYVSVKSHSYWNNRSCAATILTTFFFASGGWLTGWMDGFAGWICWICWIARWIDGWFHILDFSFRSDINKLGIITLLLVGL